MRGGGALSLSPEPLDNWVGSEQRTGLSRLTKKIPTYVLGQVWNSAERFHFGNLSLQRCRGVFSSLIHATLIYPLFTKEVYRF